MDKQKFNQILEKLLEKTEEGKLEWETTVNRDTFLTALKDTAISITQFNDSYYLFGFRNEMGEVIDKFIVKNEKLNPLAPHINLSEDIEKASRIFALARQQSLKDKQIADRILEQLAA